MCFVTTLPIPLFLPLIPIIPEEPMYPTVEKEPRTTRWPLRGSVLDPEQLAVPQYVQNLSGLEPPRLHLPLQILYVETLLLLHRGGPTNSGEGPRTGAGAVARATNIPAGTTEVSLEWPGRRQLLPQVFAVGGWHTS